MKFEENITLLLNCACCDAEMEGNSIKSVTGFQLTTYTWQTVEAKICEENYQNTNLPIKLYLFQGLPKADKMELIIQKAVELGVTEIIPTEMENCLFGR